MKNFLKFLLIKELPSDSLAGLNFTLFGLGDSGYAKFNATARKLYQRLIQLGAKEFYPRGLGRIIDIFKLIFKVMINMNLVIILNLFPGFKNLQKN